MAIVPPGIPYGAVPITGYEKYYACPDGRIYSTITNIFLKPSANKRTGRLHVGLNGVTLRVAVLVCTAFHGERPDGLTVSHLNGDVQDNRAENLAWETMKENLARRHQHGTTIDGFNNSRAKLSPEDVTYIVEARKGGTTQKEIAQTLDVSLSTVSLVLLGKRYASADIDEDVAGIFLRRKLTKDQVVAIRSDDRLQRIIAAEYGVAQTTISDIKLGKIYRTY